MKELYVKLPLSTSVNEAYRNVILWDNRGRPYCRRVSTEKLRQFREEGFLSLYRYLKEKSDWRDAIIGYEAWIFVSSIKSDLSNRLKALEDLVAEALHFNDNKIFEIRAVKIINGSSRLPHVILHLYQLQEFPSLPEEILDKLR